jgi:hypothetical protein
MMSGRGKPAPIEIVIARWSERKSLREIARRLGKSHEWVRRTMLAHELYCFGRLRSVGKLSCHREVRSAAAIPGLLRSARNDAGAG